MIDLSQFVDLIVDLSNVRTPTSAIVLAPLRISTNIAIDENGEALVRITSPIIDLPLLYKSEIPGATESGWVREDVFRRLLRAAESLPESIGLVLVDGWRSLEAQRFMFNNTMNRPGMGPGWVADPNDPLVVPPHTTGGAVDVTLSLHGQPLRLGTSPGEYTAASWLEVYEDPTRNEQIRWLRRTLFSTMVAAGFAPYAQEWWHYSYGDQEWAAYVGSSTALYGQLIGIPS